MGHTPNAHSYSLGNLRNTGFVVFEHKTQDPNSGRITSQVQKPCFFDKSWG